MKSGMKAGRGWGSCAALLLAVVNLLGACDDRNCSDEDQDVRDFLADAGNLGCSEDADCRVVKTGCHTYALGSCSQSVLNAQAAASARWLALSRRVNDCQDETCDVCGKQLAARCGDAGTCE